MLAFASGSAPVGGKRGEPLQFAVVGPELADVAALSREMCTTARRGPALGRVDLDLQLDLPQVASRWTGYAPPTSGSRAPTSPSP